MNTSILEVNKVTAQADRTTALPAVKEKLERIGGRRGVQKATTVILGPGHEGIKILQCVVVVSPHSLRRTEVNYLTVL